MSVSGADMVITANVDRATRDLLDTGMTALLELPTGEEVEATITEIAEAEGDDATGYGLVIAPQELTAEQVDALRSENIRVTIPVTSTDGEVLAVPVAALTSGPGGESRVEVQRDSTTVVVQVEVGLTADGYAEVEPVDGELATGDLVVVGQSPNNISGSAAGSTARASGPNNISGSAAGSAARASGPNNISGSAAGRDGNR